MVCAKKCNPHAKPRPSKVSHPSDNKGAVGARVDFSPALEAAAIRSRHHQAAALTILPRLRLLPLLPPYRLLCVAPEHPSAPVM